MFTIEDAPKFAGTQISVKSPGELSLYIKENEKYKIERLRILGPLNGNDILFIREMAGRDFIGEKTNGKLRYLDLSGAYFEYEGLCSQNFSSGWHTIRGCISMFMFSNCISLQSILIPSNTTLICENAFSGCANLLSVLINSSIEDISSRSFAFCDKLERISIRNNRYYSVENKGKILINKQEELILCLNSIFNKQDDIYLKKDFIKIPDKITTIKKGAFYRCTIDNLAISKNIKHIESKSFQNCRIKSLYIFSNQLKIHKEGFFDCHYFDISSSIYCLSENPPIYEGDRIDFVTKTTFLFVPMAALHKYKQDPIWKICNIIPLSLDEIDIIEKKYNNISL